MKKEQPDKLQQIIQIERELGEIQDFDVLLEMILTQTRKIVNADAGSIYIPEGNNLKIKCLNCKNKFRLYKSEEFQYNYKCVECDQKIILYKQNYKCTKCKKFLCSKCLNKHCDNCLSLRFIKLYEVGYKCEIHNSF